MYVVDNMLKINQQIQSVNQKRKAIQSLALTSKVGLGFGALAILFGVAVNYDEIKKHFRKETSKLDRWIYQKDIGDYFKDDKNELPKSKTKSKR